MEIAIVDSVTTESEAAATKVDCETGWSGNSGGDAVEPEPGDGGKEETRGAWEDGKADSEVGAKGDTVA
jgi:hypothetical protein